VDVFFETRCIVNKITWPTSYLTPLFQLSHSSGQIIAFDNWMPLVKALVLGNLCKYRNKSYIAKDCILWTTFYISDSLGLSSATLT